MQGSDHYFAGASRCSGKGGYSDLEEGAAVNISDASGAQVAKGRLDTGENKQYACVFSFSVEDVPRDQKFYKVEVTRRGAVSYTEKEAKEGVTLSIGK